LNQNAAGTGVVQHGGATAEGELRAYADREPPAPAVLESLVQVADRKGQVLDPCRGTAEPAISVLHIKALDQLQLDGSELKARHP
jgi:hypothetical protein